MNVHENESILNQFGYARVGDKWPNFTMKGVNEQGKITTYSYENNFLGNWLIAFFWPKDFTFVCPTEIQAFSQSEISGANVIGISTDNEYAHQAWKASFDPQIQIPMLSDIDRGLSESLGILDNDEMVCQRATFIINPDSIIKYVCVNDMAIGRNTDEVIRVLEALKTGGACPANWNVGDDNLTIN